MTLHEKMLYHPIHPVKFLTDWGTGLAALPLFALHRLAEALLAVLPGVFISLLVPYAQLEPLKASRFGQHISSHMTRQVEVIRLLGYVAMACGAWFHSSWMIVLGLGGMGGWTYGILNRRH
ncbi:MAG TPA: hypothetical protein VFS50_04355 [Meiothermus sp.]|jgi:hypothetical protein|nr:hypothetical protein [Meiothermus sp.]